MAIDTARMKNIKAIYLANREHLRLAGYDFMWEKRGRYTKRANGRVSILCEFDEESVPPPNVDQIIHNETYRGNITILSIVGLERVTNGVYRLFLSHVSSTRSRLLATHSPISFEDLSFTTDEIATTWDFLSGGQRSIREVAIFLNKPNSLARAHAIMKYMDRHGFIKLAKGKSRAYRMMQRPITRRPVAEGELFDPLQITPVTVADIDSCRQARNEKWREIAALS